MDLRQRRINILKRVETGELSLVDGNRLLLELDGPQAAALPGTPVLEQSESSMPGLHTDSQPEAVPAPQESPQPAGPLPEVIDAPRPAEAEPQIIHKSGWLSLWLLPFLLGLFLTLVSVNWMYLGLATAGLSWGFWLSFFPFALGVLLMWVGWELNSARWLHVRVRQRPGARPSELAFSIPLPLGLTRWAIQRFGRFAPRVNGQDVNEFLDEVDQAVATEGAMHVFVDDPDGEQVEIWIEGKNR